MLNGGRLLLSVNGGIAQLLTHGEYNCGITIIIRYWQHFFTICMD
jgi:hypothetical protein